MPNKSNGIIKRQIKHLQNCKDSQSDQKENKKLNKTFRQKINILKGTCKNWLNSVLKSNFAFHS